MTHADMIHNIILQTAAYYGVDAEEVLSRTRVTEVSRTRAVIIHRLYDEMRMCKKEIARRLNLDNSTVHYQLKRVTGCVWCSLPESTATRAPALRERE